MLAQKPLAFAMTATVPAIPAPARTSLLEKAARLLRAAPFAAEHHCAPYSRSGHDRRWTLVAASARRDVFIEHYDCPECGACWRAEAQS